MTVCFRYLPLEEARTRELYSKHTVKNGVLRYTIAMVFWDTFILCWCNATLQGILVHHGGFHNTLKRCSKVF